MSVEVGAQAWPGVIEHYARFLPVSEATPRITLLEGNTPLIPSVKVGPRLGVGVRLFFKYEGLNPTASFKDRGMTMAVSKAVEEGAECTICASTGNTSASAAAYSARAGIQSVVLIPHGYVALGKLAQALAYGARTIAVDGERQIEAFPEQKVSVRLTNRGPRVVDVQRCVQEASRCGVLRI